MATASAALEAPERADLAQLAADRLRQLLHRRHDAAVLTDLLEEELREALGSLEALRAHLEEVLGALLGERPAPLDLLEAGDDGYAQQALCRLECALGGLRQRLAQAAAHVAAAPRRA
jgi:hypothetical protein